jgi:two-component system, NarL family, invasion response regulator UvrY
MIVHQCVTACEICSRVMQTGKSCGEAVDGQDAIAKTRHLAPDVIVMDYVMPTIDGIEAARKISSVAPTTSILLFSMYMDSQLATLARHAGISAVLSKSNAGQVVKGIEAMLRGETFCASQI